jgi:ATP-dependent helicase/nuclease subunit A
VLAEIEVSVRTWTDEQLEAIERRDGDLMLAASAGSGKTSVLVERFVRAVLDDRIEVPAILTITFTEKAAAELRERIRARLRELRADDAARATEGAPISTIHGFCARVLRANALAAGIDPLFVVLDDAEATRLAGAAFDAALEELAQGTPGGVELIASYGQGTLRGAIRDAYGELRSRGEREPSLAPLDPAPSLAQARCELERAAAAAATELGALPDPGARAARALSRADRAGRAVAGRARSDRAAGRQWRRALDAGVPRVLGRACRGASRV